MAFTSPIWFDGQALSAAHAVWAVRQGAVRLRDARAAGEVIALVDGDHEQRVALVDAVRGEVLEERGEGVVVVLQLRLVRSLAGPGRRARVRVGGGVRDVGVVHVRDVAVGDGHAVLLHLLDVAERVACEHPVEAREAAGAGRVGDRLAGRVVARTAWRGDRRIDVLRAVERLEARVAAGLVGQGSGRRVGVARRTLAAVWAQWTAMPTKSVCGWPLALRSAGSFGSALRPRPRSTRASRHRRRGSCPRRVGAVFSSSMFAVPTPPTSQPARVNGTHGAGVVFCPSVIMFGSGSIDRVDLIGPVLERRREADRAVRLEVAVGVRDGLAVAIGIEPVRLERIPPAVCEIRMVWSLVNSVPLP